MKRKSSSSSSSSSSISSSSSSTTSEDLNSRQQQQQQVLTEGSDEFSNVAELFLRGLGVLLGSSCGGCIQSISCIENSREQVQDFRSQQQRMHGPANVHWTWYGGPKQEIDSIAESGFQEAVSSCVGYCFAPMDCSRISAVQAAVDDAGEQHMILCQMILGKIGLLEDDLGSESFDTRVYELPNPKSLVIPQASFDASRVLPCYRVSFKLSTQWQEIVQASHIVGKVVPLPAKLKPRRVKQRIMSFPTLFFILKTRVPSQDLAVLLNDYRQFKSGKMHREHFVSRVRHMVGDSLLYECVCFIKLCSQGCNQVVKDPDAAGQVVYRPRALLKLS